MTFKAYSQVDDAFKDFIGKSSAEDDNGWSHEVWRAAWAACLNSATQCNICGNMVVKQTQPDLPLE